MRAVAGDELLVRGRRVGDEDREGVIMEVRGEDGAAPYLVQWKDGHESVFMPSSDTLVEHRFGGQQEKLSGGRDEYGWSSAPGARR